MTGRVEAPADVVRASRPRVDARGWSRLADLLAAGDHVVSEVEVPMEGVGTFRVTSFWTVRGGRIVAGTEGWTALGGEQAPAWRERCAHPMPHGPS